MFTTLHLAFFILVVPAIIFADHMGFKYFTGRVQTLDARHIRWAHRAVMTGLLLLIISGVMIVAGNWAVWFEKPLFYAKLALVATVALNGFFIHSLMMKATVAPYAALTSEERRLLLVSGALSAIGWVGSAVIGYFGL